jgi:hypothetical protein
MAGPKLKTVLSRAIAAQKGSRQVTDEDTCEPGEEQSSDSVDVFLAPDGFEFRLGPGRGCHVFVPDAQVIPLLTREGKRTVESIRADLQKSS